MWVSLEIFTRSNNTLLFVPFVVEIKVYTLVFFFYVKELNYSYSGRIPVAILSNLSHPGNFLAGFSCPGLII